MSAKKEEMKSVMGKDHESPKSCSEEEREKRRVKEGKKDGKDE